MLNCTGWKTDEAGVRFPAGVRVFSLLQTFRIRLEAFYPKGTESPSPVLIPVRSVREADPPCPPNSGVNMVSSLPPLPQIASQRAPVPTLYYIVYCIVCIVYCIVY